LAFFERELAGGKEEGSSDGCGDLGAGRIRDSREFVAELPQAVSLFASHLAQRAFVLGRVVEQRIAGPVVGFAGGDFADEDGVVASVGGVEDPAVEVGQAVEEDGRAPGGLAVGDAVELVVIHAAGLGEVGCDVDLVFAQDAQGEGGALQDDAVGVAVVAYGHHHAGGTFGDLGDPGRGHGGHLAAPTRTEHVDAVAEVAHRGDDGFWVVFRSVHRPPFSCQTCTYSINPRVVRAVWGLRLAFAGIIALVAGGGKRREL
jgi:hypothetical protein